MYNAVMSHQGQGLQHLTGEASNQSGGEAYEAIGLDQFVQVDAQELHGDAQVTAEIKMLSHFDNMVLLFSVLNNHGIRQLSTCQR